MLNRAVMAYGMKLLGLCLSYASVIYIARNLSIADLGYYYFFIATCTMTSAVSSLGSPTIVARTLSNTPESSRGWALLGILKKYGLGSLLVALILSSAILLSNQGEMSFSSSLFLIPLASLAATLSLLMVEALRIVRGVAWAETLRNIVRPALIISMLCLGFELPLSVSIGFIFTAIFSVGLLKELLFVRGKSSGGSKSMQKNADFQAMSAASILGVLLTNSDVLILSYLVDAELVGYYGAATRYTMLISFSLLALNSVLLPLISQGSVHGFSDKKALGLIRQQVFFLRLGVTFLGVSLYFLSPFYTRLLGLDDGALDRYLLIGLVGQWLLVVLGPTGLIMTHSGKSDLLLLFNVFALFVSVFFGFYFYSTFGHIVVLLAVLGGSVLIKSMSYIYIKRRWGLWI